MKYWLLTLTILASCNYSGDSKKLLSKNNSLASDTSSEQGDSLYKIGNFLFEAKKKMKFEIVKLGKKPKTTTKGDTLYSDNQVVILGDWKSLTSHGVYSKFVLKSQFDNYKVDNIYKGNLAKPNFSSDPYAKHFISRIKEKCNSSNVNFAGHYTIVEWGCGSGCKQMAVVDRVNGDIIYSDIPFDTLDGHCGIDFKIDSRMLVINTEALEEYKGYKLNYWRKPSVYEIKNGRFRFIE